jgi:hypothetical protein
MGAIAIISASMKRTCSNLSNPKIFHLVGASAIHDAYIFCAAFEIKGGGLACILSTTTTSSYTRASVSLSDCYTSSVTMHTRRANENSFRLFANATAPGTYDPPFMTSVAIAYMFYTLNIFINAQSLYIIITVTVIME